MRGHIVLGVEAERLDAFVVHRRSKALHHGIVVGIAALGPGAKPTSLLRGSPERPPGLRPATPAIGALPLLKKGRRGEGGEEGVRGVIPCGISREPLVSPDDRLTTPMRQALTAVFVDLEAVRSKQVIGHLTRHPLNVCFVLVTGT